MRAAMDPNTMQALCKRMRREVIRAIHSVQTGHPGGSLSCCEILCALYFAHANISPENWLDPGRDKIILSKGHAAPMLYRILAEKGFFPPAEMATLRQLNSRLQGHPYPEKTPGVEVPSGPLGIAYGAALGIAMADRILGRTRCRTYAVLGDGELNEGCVWETTMAASKFCACNLITIVDRNGVQLDGTCCEIMPMGDLEAKFRAFGFHVLTCDGHSVSELVEMLETARDDHQKPTVILANTVKGKGVSFMEGKNIWHGRPIDDAHYQIAMNELKEDANDSVNS